MNLIMLLVLTLLIPWFIGLLLGYWHTEEIRKRVDKRVENKMKNKWWE